MAHHPPHDLQVQTQLLPCQNGHCKGRPAGHKSNNDPRLSHSYSYKSRLHFKEMALPLDPAALEVQNTERSSSNKFPRATTRGHELKRIRGLILHFCSNRATISKKQKLPLDPACPDLQNPKITGPKDDPRAGTRHQKVR